MATSPAATPALPTEQKPRSFWERAVTMLPVVLTLLGTALAGLSSSEMTKAQYHRALAAQNQAKVSDQWNLFQFKRTRRMIGEEAVGMSTGGAGPIEPVRLDAACRRLAILCRQGEKQTADLAKALPKKENALAEAVAQFQHQADKAATAAASAAERTRQQLVRPDVLEDLAYLGTARQPSAKQQKIEDDEVVNAKAAVVAGRLDANDVLALTRMPQQRLDQALAIAESNARVLEEAGKQTDRRLRVLDELVDAVAASVRGFHRSVLALEDVVLDADGSASESASRALASVRRTDQSLRRVAGELEDYHAAREDFNARRNDREARNHQETAQLYEVQVLKSSATADRYRVRSGQFFYGLLFAQAGAAIASLALAARQRSVLWAVAGAAGIAAVAFSAYVYLTV